MAVSGIPTAKVSPDYLHSNSTSHTWTFSAVAELIDNAYDPDVNATELWIDKRDINGETCLTFTDNGNGLMPENLHKMLSFGFCQKVAVDYRQPIGQYGNGFKSGSMRLGKDAIVFSRARDVMSVGLLSQTYLKSIEAETVLVPIVSWDLLNKTGQKTMEDQNNLSEICNNSIFKNEKELLSELESLEKFRTGTRIIIYNLKKNKDSGYLELDFFSDHSDIRNPESQFIDLATINRTVQEKSPEYKVSLREYCSILYLKPRMKIYVRGKKVNTKIISRSLSETEKDVYKPVRHDKPVRICFGFTCSKNPEDYGLVIYHNNRLIRAYDKVGYQRQPNERGVGVVGVVEATFLTPTHNKQDFIEGRKYTNFISSAGLKLNAYWDEKREGPTITGAGTSKHKVSTPDWLWSQCEICLKWRKLPDGLKKEDLPENWFCRMNPDAAFNRCEVPEEPESEDEAVKKTTYKKKKQPIVQKQKIKLHEKQQIKEKEMLLSEKERQLQKKEMEINQKKKSESYSPIVDKLRKMEEKAAKHEKKIEALHRERSRQQAASRQMLDAAEKINIISLCSVLDNLGYSELPDKVAQGASTSSPERNNGQKRKHSSDSINSNEEQESEEPISSKKLKENNSKSNSKIDPGSNNSIDASESKTEDKNPDLDKLKKQNNKIRTKEQGVQTEGHSENQEEKGFKERLESLQRNVLEVLQKREPDRDFGGPENVESIIAEILRKESTEAGKESDSRVLYSGSELSSNRMAQKSLSELKNCHSGTSKPVPYSDGVTVVVVKKGHTAKFVDSNGQQGELLNFSVADKSAPMLATLSDKTKHSKIVEGKTLLVRNFILKGGKITMSSKTSIMGKPSLEIPDEIRTSAVQLILPPSPEKKVAEVHTAPLRSICSVKGQVIKATRTVRVSGSETTLRTITIEENSSTIEITLLRELAELAINIGDTLQITHCLLNEWQGTKALNTTRNTTIQKIQPLKANVSGTVQALSLTETSWEVCLKEDNKEQLRDIVIEKDMMQNTLSHIDEACLLTEEELENVLINRIPFKLQAVMMGSRILNLQLGILPAQQIPHPQFEKME